MIYPENFEHKIGFDEVRTLLKGRCISSLGAEWVDRLAFMPGYADVKRALEIMLEEGMRERPRIAKGKRGWAYLESFGDSGINLRLAFWVKDPVNGTVGLKTAISLAVYERFQKEGIEVPFNRLDVNILPRADEAAAGAKS